VKLVFLGTRGETKGRSRCHLMHSALMVSYRGARVMIDCGFDWLGKVGPGAGANAPRPGRILITHAHPDHAWGLKDGAPCPVYASRETWRVIDSYPIQDKREAAPGTPVTYRGITFESFPVDHSIRAPANGYRVTAGRRSIFYVPDVVYIRDRPRALAGADLYVGDGATITRSFVRKRGDTLFGHAPLRTQLTWCMKEGVPQAIFTHCGTEIVSGEKKEVDAAVASMAAERGVEAAVACDGAEIILR
jgi:phosphoribosyl 1,2-cyclic phosphodiesterase